MSKLALLIPLALLACDAGGGTTGSGGDSSSAGGGTDVGGTASAGGSMGSFAGGAGGTGGSGGGEKIDEVFGHSPSTLYRLDPMTKQVSTVGSFQGCEAEVIDIALDKDSNLFATSFAGLYRVNKSTAACTLIKSGTSYPNSLSFVPAGTLDPNIEALVGYAGSTYVRIDPATGNTTTLGNLGPNSFVSSGDIVSVINGGTYLTVTGNGCADCLVEVNPATGAVTREWGPLNYGAVYGIAFWAGSVYGFTNSGELFEVTFPNDVLTTTPISAPGASAFWGAGSTTSAPPVAIPD